MPQQDKQLPTKTVLASFFILLGIFLVSGLQNADVRERIASTSLRKTEANILKSIIKDDANTIAGGDVEIVEMKQTILDVPFTERTTNDTGGDREALIKDDTADQGVQAPISQAHQLLPLRNWNIEPFETEAKSAIVTDIEAEKIIYQKNIDQRLPIASITKLMTAWVVSESASPSDTITISRRSVATEGEHGNLSIGEEITAKDLLSVMLIPSSNDAAVAFQDHFSSLGMDLVSLMNDKVRKLELRNTRFTNPAGLDAIEHYSSSYDLAKIISAMKEKEGIWATSITRNGTAKSLDGKQLHNLTNTNDLLMTRDDIVGGKTGLTPQAKGCLALILRIYGKEYIFIILGSDNRFDDMQRLIEWVTKAFIFE